MTAGDVLGDGQVEPSGDIRDLQHGPQSELCCSPLRVRRVPSLPPGEGGALHGGALQQDRHRPRHLVSHQSRTLLLQGRGPGCSLYKARPEGILIEMTFNEADQPFEFI